MAANSSITATPIKAKRTWRAGYVSKAGAPGIALLMAKLPYAVKRRTAAVNQRSKCRQTEVLFIAGSQVNKINPSIVGYRRVNRKLG
jgi:hypothetical protein